MGWLYHRVVGVQRIWNSIYWMCITYWYKECAGYLTWIFSFNFCSKIGTLPPTPLFIYKWKIWALKLWESIRSEHRQCNSGDHAVPSLVAWTPFNWGGLYMIKVMVFKINLWPGIILPKIYTSYIIIFILRFDREYSFVWCCILIVFINVNLAIF